MLVSRVTTSFPFLEQHFQFIYHHFESSSIRLPQIFILLIYIWFPPGAFVLTLSCASSSVSLEVGWGANLKWSIWLGQRRWATYCANLIRVHTFRSGSKLFGRAANFSVRPQTFRSGSKLFCQAADCSVAHQTFRSRIKLSGRASNFSVRLCSLYNLPQAANVLQVPSVGISTIHMPIVIFLSATSLCGIIMIYSSSSLWIIFYLLFASIIFNL